MTADERLEKLLNRAGQTINDLPTWGGNVRRLERAKREALTEMGCRWTDYPGMSGAEAPLLEYILKLAGIIDRMETALENVLGERDWMIRKMRDIGFCDTCYFHRFSTELTSPPECEACDPNIWENIMYCYSGVPEDWRADDG